MNKYLIAVVGPTAIGKTRMAIQLAQAFNTEIVSADSRQFYREMSIGTAVPNIDELKAVKHHFIHHKSIEDSYSVGDFEKEALNALDKIFQARDLAILVGGSGLYVDAVVKGLDDFPKISPKVRRTLNETLKEKGLQFLQDQLRDLDPAAYGNIEIDNPHRLIRALEISIGTNRPYSSYLTNQSKKRPFKTIYLGLTAPRETIYHRINERVEQMMSMGLLKEVEKLEHYRRHNALNTVGYKELFIYLDGKCTLDDAIAEIKKNTRRYAKRQLTWYRKNEAIHWFDYNTKIESIVKFLNLKFNEY